MKNLFKLLIMLGTMFASVAAYTAEDPFQQMRTRWQSYLIGNTGTKVDSTTFNGAQQYLRTISKVNDADFLWADARGWHNTNGILASAVVTANFKRLESMALAYAHPMSPLHNSSDLRTAILNGLDWMVIHHYHANMQAYGNWWDWQIGTPRHIVNTLALMYSDIPEGLLNRCLAAIDYFVPNPTRRTLRNGIVGEEIETGANRLDKALTSSLRGILGNSEQHISAGRDAIAQTLNPVVKGDGFYADGSFIQHGHIAYTGSYGLVALDDYAKLVYLHAGSKWPLPANTLSLILHWAREAYLPWLFDGAMADSVRGRRISTELQDDRFSGNRTLAALATLIISAESSTADDLKALVKGNVERDHSLRNKIDSGTFLNYEMQQLQKLVSDKSVTAKAATIGARIYPNMDRAILHAPGFGFVISMYSDRISAFEFGNGENKRGWWNGIGMTSLYNADQSQYGSNYWPTVDAWRLPGTTTDHSGSGVPPAWQRLGNRDGWAGGAQLNGYAAVALKFNLKDVTGSDLEGKKSWFLMGSYVVATGASIRGSGSVETIIDNRKIQAAGQNSLTVDGELHIPFQAIQNKSGEHQDNLNPVISIGEKDLPKAAWAHIAGDVPAASIGYVFPERGPLHLLREIRSGNWREINSMESPMPVQNTFLSLSFSHGLQPKHASYSYVLIPGASAQETESFASNSNVVLEENSDYVSAVTDANLGIVAANFWKAATLNVSGRPLIMSDSAISLVVQKDTEMITLSIAEPTQKAHAPIQLELLHPVKGVLQSDPRIKVISLSPTLKLSIDTTGSAGGSLIAAFALSQ